MLSNMLNDLAEAMKALEGKKTRHQLNGMLFNSFMRVAVHVVDYNPEYPSVQ